jgi:hypothetical protein
MTQQGARQESAFGLSLWPTATTYNEDLLRLFDAEGVTGATFNERQLRFINARLSASYTNINQAMQAFAASKGAYNWSSLGTLDT